MDELLQDFLSETGEHIEAAGAHLVQFERDPTDTRDIASIYRLVHSIKGTCGFIGLPRLERLAHSAETLVAQLRDGVPSTRDTVSLVLATVDRIKFILSELSAQAAEPAGDDADLIGAIALATRGMEPAPEAAPGAAEAGDDPPVPFGSPPAAAQEAPQLPAAEPTGPREGKVGPPRRHDSIRVAVTLLETLMRLVSELVLTRNQLAETTASSDDGATQRALGEFSTLLSDLQDTVMRARMQPLERLFGSLARLNRELGRELNKPIDLIVSGADTELDRQLIELVRDPLMHLIRNCADHGIEPPAKRVAAGKTEAGRIEVAAAHESGAVVIRVADDGRGMDIPRIRAKATAMGLTTAAELESMGDSEVCRFIFAPGFSTAAAVTTVSGRGMGMDIVRRSLEGVGGSIELATTAGRGTTFTLKIPLTLAIAPALIVGIGTERFAVPQNAVTEIVDLSFGGAARLERVGGALLLRLRNDILPVRALSSILRLDDADPTDAPRFAVMMRVGRFRFGIIVDAVSGTQEIVVKPLMSILRAADLFSGNTILGDGSVVLILDAGAIARSIDARRSQEGSVAAVAPDDVVVDRHLTSLLLFRAGPGAMKALPLTLVARIVVIAAEGVSRAEDGFVAIHDGRMMPLVYAGSRDDLPDVPTWPILVIEVNGEPMGIMVTEIVDIVAVPLGVELSSRAADLVGMTEVLGRPVEMLDITWFMRTARPEAFARGRSRRARVLLVEDKPFFRDLLAPAVIAAGYDVTITSGAVGALSALRTGGPFDAVATDIDMPGMSGYALVRTLRADPAFAGVPVIGLASVVAPSVHSAAAMAGMNDVVGKLDRSALVETLAKALHPEIMQSFALEAAVLSGQAA